MVSVMVRETYDIKTTVNKMTVISIHTPKPEIIERNYPGLLMQCRAYRPKQANVRIACASVLPLDPLGVGTTEGTVAPEDAFNPILYKAISNKGMSQLETRLQALKVSADINGQGASVSVDAATGVTDEFNIYYGLLSQAGMWKHANPQSGLAMSGLRPLVYDVVASIGDTADTAGSTGMQPPVFIDTGQVPIQQIIGEAKPMPWLNSTYFKSGTENSQAPGFDISPANHAIHVPFINIVCGVIIIPPSKRHELFFRMVCEWEIEFSSIRPLSEVTNWTGLGQVGYATHYQNYTYSKVKEALTGEADTICDNDACMVSSNVDINKVM